MSVWRHLIIIIIIIWIHYYSVITSLFQNDNFYLSNSNNNNSFKSFFFRFQSSPQHRNSPYEGLQLPNFDRGDRSVQVLLDLITAFNTIDHSVLPLLEPCIGLKGTALHLLNLYLSNKTFSVSSFLLWCSSRVHSRPFVIFNMHAFSQPDNSEPLCLPPVLH